MSFVSTWQQHDFAAVSQMIAAKTPADVHRALERVGRGDRKSVV